ncbi:MAG: leucine-rich repeat domain-containing protein [Clostridia bacterium]
MDKTTKFFNIEEYKEIYSFYLKPQGCEYFETECKYMDILSEILKDNDKNSVLKAQLEQLSSCVNDMVEAKNKVAFFYGFTKCEQMKNNVISSNLFDEFEQIPEKCEPVIFECSQDGTVLFSYKGKDELANVVIPDGVCVIAGSAFENCTKITSVTLPDGVRLIDDKAFAGCENLKTINIPNSVKKVSKDAFEGCEKLVLDVKFN